MAFNHLDKQDRRIVASLIAVLAIMTSYIAYVSYDPAKPAGGAVLGGLSLTAAMLALWILDSVRFRWAGRVIGAELFLASLVYLWHQWQVGPAGFFGGFGQPSGYKALFFFFTIGVPSLAYASFGHYRWLPPWMRHGSGNEE